MTTLSIMRLKMGNSKEGIAEDGSKKHYSAGVIIEKDGKYLLLDRVKKPLGFASPAGHVDEGEDYETAGIREVLEEAGLRVLSLKLLIHEELPWNECSKGVGVHEWKVYSCKFEGEVKTNPAESKSYGWYTPEQMKNLNLEEVWNYWFKKLGVLE